MERACGAGGSEAEGDPERRAEVLEIGFMDLGQMEFA